MEKSWEGLLSAHNYDEKLGTGECPDCGHHRTRHTAYAQPILKGCTGGEGISGNPDTGDIGKCGCLRYVPEDERPDHELCSCGHFMLRHSEGMCYGSWQNSGESGDDPCGGVCTNDYQSLLCPVCNHATWEHSSTFHNGTAAERCFHIEDGEDCNCLYYVEKFENMKEGGNMPDDEVGKGSPLKKWVCSCKIHTVNLETGQTRTGPYIIRCTGNGLVAVCQWCDQPFRRVDEGLPRKRKSKICGAHCPEGAHNHD